MRIYQHTLEFSVRDYECDMSGIVNNSVYQNYIEHARHSLLKDWGAAFSDWIARGYHVVVIRIEIDYLQALRSGDRFIVGTDGYRVSRLRFGFAQDIYRLPDFKEIIRARVTAAVIDERGKPALPAALEKVLTDRFQHQETKIK